MKTGAKRSVAASQRRAVIIETIRALIAEDSADGSIGFACRIADVPFRRRIAAALGISYYAITQALKQAGVL